MADERKQRFSLTGMVVIAVFAIITYVLVQSRSLLILYILATTLLVGLLVSVGFDLGVEKNAGTLEENEPEVDETPVEVLTPKVKSRKRRR